MIGLVDYAKRGSLAEAFDDRFEPFDLRQRISDTTGVGMLTCAK